MKAQKLGLVLGINMIAVCLTMQGCKATKPGKPAPRRTEPTQTITVISTPAARKPPVVTPVAEPQVAPQPTQPVAVVAPLPPPPPEPAPVVTPVAPAPVVPVAKTQSAVRDIKPLPPPPPKTPKPKAKPAAKPATAPVAAPADAPAEYVVKSGDTLFLISKRTNYRQAAILAANPGLNPKRLRVGQKLKMPGAVAAAPAVAKVAAPEAKPAEKDSGNKVMPAAAPSPAAANTKAPVKTKNAFVAYEGPTKEYVVKSGDSLGKIASEYGISIRALKALNGLQVNQLRAGQKLKVPTEKQTAAASKAPTAKAEKPAAPEAGKKPAAEAKPADAKPAAEAKSAEAKSAEKKPVETKPVAEAKLETKPAAEVKPAEEAKPVAEAAPAPSAPVEKPLPTYTVKEGDDLVSIAIAFGISPSALMDINDLKPTDEVKPGQVLKLPPNAKVNVQ